MILLNPGPVNVSERVRNALQRPDICHRETECAELLQGIQQKILRAFVPGTESDYVAAVVTGSGTAAVEAAVLSSIPQGNRALVINNGVYGARLSTMVNTDRLGVAELTVDWTTRPDPERLFLALDQRPEIQTVAMVHHETTTGLINPVKEIAQVVEAQHRVFVLDSVSGLGGESVDIPGAGLALVAGTAGKCIQGFPGVSFVLIRRSFLARMKAYPPRSVYLHLPFYVDEDGNSVIPFTPAVQVLYGFDEALSELLEEGVGNRIQRFKRHAGLIRTRMAELGMQPVLPAEWQSNTLTSYYLPSGVSYQILHDRLKEQGYVIYAGQGQLASTIFRVANMGSLKDQDIQGFLVAFEQAVDVLANRS